MARPVAGVVVALVGFGGVVLYMLWKEGEAVSIEVSAAGLVVGASVLFLVFVGAAWWAWSVGPAAGGGTAVDQATEALAEEEQGQDAALFTGARKEARRRVGEPGAVFRSRPVPGGLVAWLVVGEEVVERSRLGPWIKVTTRRGVTGWVLGSRLLQG